MDCHGAGNGWSFNSLIPDQLDPRCEFVVQREWTEYTEFSRGRAATPRSSSASTHAPARPTAASTTPCRARTGARSASTAWRSARSASTPRSAAPGAARCCWSPATRPCAASRPSCSAPGSRPWPSSRAWAGTAPATSRPPSRATMIEEGARNGARRPHRGRAVRPWAPLRDRGRACQLRPRRAVPPPARCRDPRLAPSDLARRRLVVGLERLLPLPRLAGVTRTYPTVVELIGGTPLVRLQAVTRDVPATVVAKLEYLNPGGSVKDRIGIRMIEAAERDGRLRAGRHHRRADLGQHRRRPGHRRRHQGLPLHLRDARQDEPREDLAAAGLRRRGRDLPDRGRARVARELLLGVRPAGRGDPRRRSSPTSTPTWPTRRPTTAPPAPRSGSRPAASSTRW